MNSIKVPNTSATYPPFSTYIILVKFPPSIKFKTPIRCRITKTYKNYVYPKPNEVPYIDSLLNSELYTSVIEYIHKFLKELFKGFFNAFFIIPSNSNLEFLQIFMALIFSWSTKASILLNLRSFMKK